MNPKLNFATSIQTVVAAAAATVIALGILWGTVYLSERNGRPLERLAAAERACAHHGYLSDRQTCMNDWLVRAQSATVAGK